MGSLKVPPRRNTRDDLATVHKLIFIFLLIFQFISQSCVDQKMAEGKERPHGLTYGGFQPHSADVIENA